MWQTLDGKEMKVCYKAPICNTACMCGAQPAHGPLSYAAVEVGSIEKHQIIQQQSCTIKPKPLR